MKKINSSSTILSRLPDFTLRFRWWIITSFAAISLLFLVQLPKATIDPDIKSMIPNDVSSRLRFDQIVEHFGGSEFILIAILDKNILKPSTLKRVQAISQDLARRPSFENIYSLDTMKHLQLADDALKVSSFLRPFPESREELDTLKARLIDNELVYGKILSRELDATAILAFLPSDVKDAEILRDVKAVLKNHPGPEAIHVGGLPYFRAAISDYVKVDMSIFLPIGLILMLGFLFLCFRSFRGMLLPFTVVVISIIVSLGIIPLVGWRIHLITILLPVMMIAIANDYGIHIIAQYQETIRAHPDWNKEQVLKQVLDSLSGPVNAAAITTMAGFSALLAHIIVPAKELGILAAIGIALALASSLLLIPAVLSILPLPTNLKSKKRKSPFTIWLERITEAIIKYPKTILILATIIILISAVGILFIRVDTSIVKFFKSNSPIAAADQIISDHFGGSTNLGVLARGDMNSPEIISAIDKLHQEWASRPNIGDVTSISEFLRYMHRTIQPEQSLIAPLPQSSDELAQYFLLYSLSGDPEDLEKMIDFNYEYAFINAKLKHSSINRINDEIDYIHNYIKTHPSSPFVLVGGYADVLSEVATAIVNGQLISLVFALIIVAVIVSLFFRSLGPGLLVTIPILLATTILFGIMGYTGIALDVVTTLLSSVMIGVGVDYSIHFLWRLRIHLTEGLTYEDAIRMTLKSIGRGIIFNALSVIIGFIILVLSNFVPIIFYGILVTICISSCLIAALIILPALCMVWKPVRFLGLQE